MGSLSPENRSNFLAVLERALTAPMGLRIISSNRSALKRILFEAKADMPVDHPIHSLVFLMSPLSEDELYILSKEAYEYVKAEKSSGVAPGGGLEKVEGLVSKTRLRECDPETGE